MRETEDDRGINPGSQVQSCSIAEEGGRTEGQGKGCSRDAIGEAEGRACSAGGDKEDRKVSSFLVSVQCCFCTSALDGTGLYRRLLCLEKVAAATTNNQAM